MSANEENVVGRQGHQVAPILDYPTRGPRRMLSIRPLWPLVVGTLTTTVITGGGILTLVGAVTNSTRGATRSTRLEWQARQQEIEQSIAAEQSAVPTSPSADHEKPSQS